MFFSFRLDERGHTMASLKITQADNGHHPSHHPLLGLDHSYRGLDPGRPAGGGVTSQTPLVPS